MRRPWRLWALGFGKKGMPEGGVEVLVEALVGFLPHGGLETEWHDFQVAVVREVPGSEAGLSDLVRGGGFAQELGAVGVASHEVPGVGVVAGDPGEELTDIHVFFLLVNWLVELAGEIGDVG